MGGVRSITANGSTLYLSTDYEDRVTRFDFGTGAGQSGVYATEAYNGLGVRFFRHDAQGHDHSAQYDGASPGAALLYDSAGGSVYTPGVAQTVKGLTLYTNADALGSVHDTQTNGDTDHDQRRFDAFGLPVVARGPDAFPLGFAAASSYQTDSDTGLMLLGNRYYDPSIGRFLSQDPAKAGGNWYAYCGNDPLGYTDPTGLSLNASCPYAPRSTGDAFAGLMSSWNGYDSPGFGDEQTRQRTVTTTMTTLPDGTTAFAQSAGPWSEWQGGGYLQLTAGRSTGVDWAAIGRSAGRYWKVFGILGIGGLAFRPAIDGWYHFQNGRTQSNAIHEMKKRENEYEAGLLSRKAMGQNPGGSFDANYDKFRALIQYDQMGGINSAGKAASDAASTIYNSFPP